MRQWSRTLLGHLRRYSTGAAPLGLLLLLSTTVLAQDVQTYLDRSTIELGQTAQLIVRVTGAPGTLMPGNLTVPRAHTRMVSQNASFSLLNGRAESVHEFIYSITPTEEGSLSIPSIRLEMGGQVFQTTPQVLEVNPPAPPPATPPSTPTRPHYPRNPGIPGLRFYPPVDSGAPEDPERKPMWVEADVNKKSVYQNEPVVYDFRFYNSVRMFGDSSYTPSRPPGALVLEFPQHNSSELFGDRMYSVNGVKTAFFPVTTGKLEFPPTTLQTTPALTLRPQTLQTEPVVVEVKPLPEGQPENFCGGVGMFSFKCELDSESVRVGEPVTLIRTVEGNGHSDLITQLPLPALPGFRVFDTESEGKTQALGDEIYCKKTFRTVLIPDKAGRLLISNLTLSTFDPVREEYQTYTADDLELEVLPGVGPAASPTPDASDATETGSPDPQEALGLRPLMETARPARDEWTSRPLFWWLQLLPALTLAGLFGLPWLGRHSRNLKESWGQVTPEKRLWQGLAGAKSEGELSGVLREYLNHKLEGVGWTLKQLPDRLQQLGLSSDEAERLTGLLARFDEARYAGSQSQGSLAELRRESEELLGKL